MRFLFNPKLLTPALVHTKIPISYAQIAHPHCSQLLLLYPLFWIIEFFFNAHQRKWSSDSDSEGQITYNEITKELFFFQLYFSYNLQFFNFEISSNIIIHFTSFSAVLKCIEEKMKRNCYLHLLFPLNPFLFMLLF